MWRRTISESADSDQSISDEEDFNVSHRFHSSANSDKKVTSPPKEGLLLQSRLEILKAKEEQRWAENSNFLNKSHVLVQDEVEPPDFPDDNISTRAEYIQSVHKDKKYTAASAAGQLCQEANVHSLAGAVRHGGLSMKKCILSRDKAAFAAGQSRQEANVPCLAGAVKHEGWSMASKEANALIHLNKASCSSLRQTSKSSKGFKRRTKPRFSFRFQPSISRFHGTSDPPEAIQHINAENSMQWVVCDSEEENESWREISHTKVEPVGNRVMEHSLAELLDGIQNKKILSKRNSCMDVHKKRKRLQLAVKRSVSSSRDRIDSNHESDQLSLGSSSDEEVAHRDRELFNPVKKETIMDRFEEALATATFSNEGSLFLGSKQSSYCLFGKLQLLIQSEKGRDASFMKKLQMGSIPNDVSHSMTVKILSRYMEAKLTICVCSFAKDMKDEGEVIILSCI
ncbi:unnamed protein product [Linum tenue]|uniref:Uncharacterized protein n=1 Tax=Linum tenue TaxID=586396 RepID=A0AAV0KV05_9ROSI|nr:unnamed protein product [Linum tenue]